MSGEVASPPLFGVKWTLKKKRFFFFFFADNSLESVLVSVQNVCFLVLKAIL